MTQTADTPAPLSPAARYRALFTVLTAAFLAPLDFFIVNVSLPTLERDLHATAGQLQLVIAMYAASYAVLLITGGRLGDIFGRKRMFLIGLAGFTIASALCGFAPNAWVLILSRGLQGAFGAMMFPQGLSVIQVLFPPQERGTAFALTGMVQGLGAFMGNVAGGALLHANLFGLEWRPLFLVNLPIGIIALFAAWVFLPESKSQTARTLDIGGVLLATTALLGIIVPLSMGRESGWPLWTICALLVGSALIPVFLWWERRVEASGKSPLLELRLFQEPAFGWGVLTGMVFFTVPPTFALMFTVFLQQGKMFPPDRAGYTFIPFTIAFVTASLSAVKFSQRFGSRVIHIGLSLMLLGIAALIALMKTGNDFALTGPVLLAMLLYGAGQGCVMPMIQRATLSRVPANDAGSAAGTLTTLQQVGGALGVALTVGIFFAMLGTGATPADFVRVTPLTLGINAFMLITAFFFALRLPKTLSAAPASPK